MRGQKIMDAPVAADSYSSGTILIDAAGVGDAGSNAANAAVARKPLALAVINAAASAVRCHSADSAGDLAAQSRIATSSAPPQEAGLIAAARIMLPDNPGTHRKNPLACNRPRPPYRLAAWPIEDSAPPKPKRRQPGNARWHYLTEAWGWRGTIRCAGCHASWPEANQ